MFFLLHLGDCARVLLNKIMSLFSFIEAQLMKQDKKLFMKQDGAALV